MPKRDDKYLVYGDDNRDEQRQLEDMAMDADELLASRSKKKKKTRKPAQEDYLNDLDDLDTDSDDGQDANADEEEDEENALNQDTEPEDQEQTAEEPPTQEEKPAEQSTEPKKKKKNYVIIIIILIIVFAVLLMIIALMKPAANRSSSSADQSGLQIEQTVRPEAETALPAATTTSDSGAITTGTVGFLTTVDKTKEYQLTDTLEVARTINSAALSYLNTLSKNVQLSADTDINLKSELSVRRAMLDIDISTLKDYETMFAAFSGTEYIQSCENRFSNIRDMYDAAMLDYDSSATRIEAVNQYIQKENSLAETSKEALRSYLDKNNIEYTETSEGFEYSGVKATTASAPEVTAETNQGE